jgi:glutamine synthetase
LRTGLEGAAESEDETKKSRTRFSPDNIYDAIRLFKGSTFAKGLFGETVHNKFAELKTASAERCPKALGSTVKSNEVQFHHEVTNQYLWNQF